jgi:hypothetical protein
MTERVTRRLAMQWIGGIAAGVILSPAPYALIDDLTIATQTRGRSTPLPRGPLGVVPSRCTACPRACSIAVRTVGGKPYLVTPATGHASSCALRPAVHQIALRPDRSRHAIEIDRHGNATMAADEGLQLTAQWIDRASDEGSSIGLIDLSGRPALGTPMRALARALPTALTIDGMPHWLDALGARWDLPSDRELCIDPTLAITAARFSPGVVLGPARGITLSTPLDEVLAALHRARASGVLFAEDGVNALPDDRTLDRLAEVEARMDAVGRDRLLTMRRRIGTQLPLGTVEDGSLDLLVVDASRAMGAVAWRRIRKLLHPTRGRMIVFATGDGPAARHANLVLPAPAPLEIEECAGGERFGLGTRMAVSPAVHPSRGTGVDAFDLAASIDPGSTARRGAQALACDVAELGRGTLLAPDGARTPISALDLSTLADRLRGGAVWVDDPVDEPQVRTSKTAPRSGDPAHSLHLLIEGAPVLASGERVPDVLSKLSLEHALVPRSGFARVHPELLRELRVNDRTRCRVQTAAGGLEVVVRADASVHPRTVLVGSGLGPSAFGMRTGSADRDPLEVLDFDPRSHAPLEILSVEVLG